MLCERKGAGFPAQNLHRHVNISFVGQPNGCPTYIVPWLYVDSMGSISIVGAEKNQADAEMILGIGL